MIILASEFKHLREELQLELHQVPYSCMKYQMTSLSVLWY